MSQRLARAIVGLFAIFSARSVFAEASANWPQFRGADAAGAAAGAGAPETWDVASGKNIRWNVAIPGLAHSAPIVWDDKVFITTATKAGADQVLTTGLYGDIEPVEETGPVDWRVICLDKSTGKVRWEQTATSGLPKVKRHPKSSHANCTPATDGKHLVAFFGSEGIYCYDFDGKLIWKKDLGLLDSGYYEVPTAQWGFASSPVIYKDKLIIQCDVQAKSFIAALDINTGNELWRTPREDVPTWSTPAIVETASGVQIVCNGWKQIAGYNLEDGKMLWWMKGGGDIPVPTPIVSNGLTFITNAHGPGAPMYAINLANAKGDISLEKDKTSNAAITWSVPRGGNYMQTPIVSGDLLFACLDNGRLTCWKSSTGEQLFKEPLSADRKGFTASPVASGGRLYFPAEDGTVYVVAGSAPFKKLAENPLGEECMATPAVSDGMILFRTRGHLIAVGEK